MIAGTLASLPGEEGSKWGGRRVELPAAKETLSVNDTPTRGGPASRTRGAMPRAHQNGPTTPADNQERPRKSEARREDHNSASTGVRISH